MTCTLASPSALRALIAGCVAWLATGTASADLPDFTELVEEDPAREGVSGFASGQTCAGSFPQFQAAHPFQGKEGPFQSSQFAQAIASPFCQKN